ncbi:Ig-like domain-containing protein [Paradesertivirga mongoliensis]|uniref:Ig-like domain-containing protein n=1 Tax=Paradesertivirga mongoliensis TaxID=2100740 RepID=A0ABW4ZHW2_9SPHI|nr:Ig-like domain-containing protein [Pedobacter mongoliensis]
MVNRIVNSRRIRKFLLATSIIVITVSHNSMAQTALPKYTGYSTPSPSPGAPGESFNPPMSGNTAAANTPVCAEWTRTAGRDESMVITGANFTRHSGADEGKDTRFTVYSSSGLQKDASIQRLERSKTVITLDKNIPSWSMYLVWPANDAGYGAPIAVNKTDAWWVGPEKATRGSSVSIYGRNLSQYNDSTASYVYIKSSTGAGQWATVTKVNPYKVDFTVPAGLANGDYEIWTHNGHGGEYGWSGPLKLNINDGAKWTTTTFNVADFGAVGNGLTDDTDAIYRAFAAAKQSYGSTVYFPAGTYMISRMLNPSNNTQWKGAGQDKTFIKCNASFSSGNDAMVYGIVSTFQVSDITFDTNNNYRAIHSSPFFLRGSRDVKVNNVTLSFANYDVMQLDNTRGVTLTNSKLIGKISFLGIASQLFIDNCHFYLTNDTELALHSWGGLGISITNSTCRDLNNSDPNNGAGWGKGRFFVATGNTGSGGQTYLGNNRTYDLTVRENSSVDQNSGEQFLWEGFSSRWSGPVISSSNMVTNVSGFTETLEKAKIAVIIKGKGLGQSRRVIAATGTSLTLETPWNLPPDASSIIAVGHYADKIVMYNNYIDGKSYAVTSPNPSASAGIEPYGGVLNFIADRNTISEVRAAIANWSTQHFTGIDPNYFSLYTNNKIIGCRWAVQNGLDMHRPAETALLGSIFRKNTIGTTLQSGIINTIMATSTPVLENFVYEHNQFDNVRTAFSTGGDLGLPNGFPSDGTGIAHQLFYKNNFGSSSNLSGITVTPFVALRENTFTGFAADYSGLLREPVIEAPLRVIEIKGTTGSNVSELFSIWNSGITSINWKASSDASWLKLSDTTGVITDERKSGNITLTANTSALSAGRHTATITSIAGNHTKKYTVILNLSASNAPQIAITSPAVNSTFKTPALVAITANASDQDGTVTKVEFYSGETKLGEDLTSPYTYTWSNTVAGTYTLTAKATDNSGHSTISAPINIELTNPIVAVAPSVALTSPSAASTFTAPALVNITATATDQDGTISKVEFFFDTTKLGEDVSSPYTFSWADVKAGSYTITAKATDNSGLSTTSAAIKLNVTAPALESAPESAPIVACAGTGSIVWEYWSNITGSNNIFAIPLNTAPTGTRTLTSFSAPVEFGDNYGARIRGYICPPVSGNYVFYISSDDNGELWLSSNDDPSTKKKIASVGDWTSPGQYDKYPTQQSAVINLVAGQRYYIEALHKEGGGTLDHLSIGWKLPDGSLQRPIPGTNLIPFQEPVSSEPVAIAPAVAISSPANNSSLTAPASVTITASANDQDGTISKVEFFSGTTKLGEDLTSPYTYAWSNVTAGSYTITAKATDNSGLSTTSATVNLTINAPAPIVACAGTGSIVWEYWSNITGSNNIFAIPLNTTPTGTRTLTNFSAPVEFGDNYGARIRGYICPPVSGNYVFYIASDDNGELWLSSNDDPSSKKKIASVGDWTSPGQYDKYPTQQSAVINLVAGQRYYIEALHKEGGGTLDHLSIGWKLPDGSLQRPIPGTNLIPFQEPVISEPVAIAPAVAISSPANNSSLTAPASVTITASANDKDGTISKVEFFSGTTKLGEDLTSPYTYAWSNVTAGSYTITAKATDNSGLSTTSATVNISVSAPVAQVAPAIAITAPSAISTFTAPASVSITATASDQDGTISKVEFFSGTTKLGEDLTSPYTYAWSNVTAGSYTITAKATDNSGLSTTSSSLSFNVNAPEPVVACTGTGSIVWEYWSNISGTMVNLIPLGNKATGTKTLTSFASPVQFGDYYGARIRGYICPPVSGTYVFYIAGDDRAELWLSTDGNPVNKKKIAYSDSWTNLGQYDKFKAQQSVSIELKANQRYYIEALHKEGYGANDFVSVGWKLPDGSLQRPIKGAHLIPFEEISAPLVSISSFTENATIAPIATPITAEASDPNGSIQKVEFYAGDIKIGESYTKPYSVVWRNISPGLHILTAKATNNLGISSVSDHLQVTVDARLSSTAGPTLTAFPNPFAEYINLEFTGIEATDVNLQIFNLQGILLKTLYKGKVEGNMTYTHRFNGNEYPNGTYLCRLTYGNKAISKLIILNK